MFLPCKIVLQRCLQRRSFVEIKMCYFGTETWSQEKVFFQKTTHKGNDSRNLDYNPEVSREGYFFTWAIFIKKKKTFYLCTSKASADVCFILCWRGFYWFLWTCGIVDFIFHDFSHLSYRSHVLSFSRTVVFFVVIQWQQKCENLCQFTCISYSVVKSNIFENLHNFSTLN